MDNNTLISTEGQFGESEYGQRMDYSTKPKYQDLWAAIVYILHVCLIIGVCVYLWATQMQTVNGSGSNSGDNATIDFTGIFVAILCCMIAGTVFGLVWLQIIKHFAEFIIKAMLFINIAMWLVLAAVGVMISIAITVVAGIVALIWILWTWCVWKRIPFASALLSIASAIVQTYPGTICISLTVIFFNIVWNFIWFSAFVGYIIVADNKGNTNNFIVFLLMISYYWGLQVNKNISHTTTCGVAATWYFSPPSLISNPTNGALKRTMTTSFGSVCMGSFIVAFLQACRAMIRANRRNACCVCIALCILGCIEALIRYFNMYAFAHVAIYGTSFVSSAKATWDLFMSRGIMAIINDDLSGMALVCGSIFGFIVSGLVGFFVADAFYHDDKDWYPAVPIVCAVVGAIIGYIFCISVLMVVRSSIVCLFVCYSEDPATMQNNRTAEYNRVTAAKAEWAGVANNFPGQGQGTQPAQQTFT